MNVAPDEVINKPRVGELQGDIKCQKVKTILL